MDSKTVHKYQRGFTMVEVIVVAVIIAVLSIAGGQLYKGYVDNTRQEALGGIVEAAAAKARLYYRKTGSEPADISVLDLRLPKSSGYDAKINGGWVVIADNR